VTFLLLEGRNGEVAAVMLFTVVVFWLAKVDATLVRFMRGFGLLPWKIARMQVRPLAIFSIIALLGLAFILRPVAALAIIAIAICVASLVVLRTLSYCTFPKKLADFRLSVLITIAGLAGWAMPAFTPLILIASGWRMARRGAKMQWLLD
jgi:hypothetical protein